MKKLMMFVAIATMAFGAFAEEVVVPGGSKEGNVPTSYVYGYTWTIDINNIDSTYTLPKDLTVELFNSKNIRLAVLEQSMFDDKFNLARNDKTGEFVANEYAAANELRTYYTAGELQLNTEDQTTGKQNIHMSASFKTPDNYSELYNYLRGATDSLKVVLSGTDATTKEKTYQTLEIGWALKDTKTFAAAAEYKPSSVPEPTSGLLMLFGLAGLALKRKRA